MTRVALLVTVLAALCYTSHAFPLITDTLSNASNIINDAMNMIDDILNDAKSGSLNIMDSTKKTADSILRNLRLKVLGIESKINNIKKTTEERTMDPIEMIKIRGKSDKTMDGFLGGNVGGIEGIPGWGRWGRE